MIVGILVAIIGALGTVFAGYIVSRTNQQDRVLERIDINVNSRLDKLLKRLQLGDEELGELRSKASERNRRFDDPPHNPEP